MRGIEQTRKGARPPRLMIAVALMVLPVAANASRIQAGAEPARPHDRVVVAEPALQDSISGVRPVASAPGSRGL